MWLFNEKFERALARFNEIAAARDTGGVRPLPSSE